MTKQLHQLTIKETLDGVKNKDFTMKEVAEMTYRVAHEADSDYNCYVTVVKDLLKQVDAQTDTELGGLPIAIKDNVATKGLRTTASSLVLNLFEPTYDATISQKLKTAGISIIGKTNLDAWAHGSSTETSQFDRTLNPRNPEHLPGGSSGGSAAAVAADACIGAIGTETAGSIRQPSAWCGVVGLKPTYGRVSRSGVIAMASSTDSPGPITKTVEDSAILLNYLAGHDPYDSTTSNQEVPDFTTALGKSIKGIKVGVLYQDIEGLDLVQPHVAKAAEVLKQLGATVEEVKAFDPHYAISVYTIIQRGEVSSNLARYDGIRYGNDRSHFGDEAKRRVMLGTYTLSKGYADQYYLIAQKVRTKFIEDYQQLFKKYDVLISATSPSFAKKVGVSENSSMFGELEDMLLEPSSISGLPGINVPCYRDPKTNLYLGLNIMAPMWQEEKMISVADAYEKNTEWNSWRNDE